MIYNVSLEINVIGNNPLEAVKELDQMLKNPDNFWQYYVQEEGTSTIFSIDLQEEDEDAIIEIKDYEPIIKLS